MMMMMIMVVVVVVVVVGDNISKRWTTQTNSIISLVKDQK